MLPVIISVKIAALEVTYGTHGKAFTKPSLKAANKEIHTIKLPNV